MGIIRYGPESDPSMNDVLDTNREDRCRPGVQVMGLTEDRMALRE